jgi:hypothetical protein
MKTNNDTFDVSIFEIDKAKNLVNLTKLAKCFNKDVNQWKRLPNTVAFLKAWKVENPLCENYITVIQGGNGEQGTWAHREIALKLSQWISPQFEVFCIKKLDELFQVGHTTLVPQGIQQALDLQPIEIIKVIPNAFYETLLKVEPRKTRLDLAKYHKQAIEKGLIG